MPQPLNTTFTKFQLTQEETIQANVLTPLQKASYQTLRADLAEEKLNLDYDPDKPLEFVKRREFLSGMIAAYDGLLQAAETTETFLQTRNINR